jgi:hypothetical protein
MLFTNVKYYYIGHSAHNMEIVTEYRKSGKPQQPFAVILNYVEIYFNVVLTIAQNKALIMSKLLTPRFQCLPSQLKQ